MIDFMGNTRVTQDLLGLCMSMQSLICIRVDYTVYLRRVRLNSGVESGGLEWMYPPPDLKPGGAEPPGREVYNDDLL